MNHMDTERALLTWRQARERLLADDPTLEDDEAALIELLGPEQGNLDDIVARLLRAARHAGKMSDMAQGMASEMSARAKRYDARDQSLRNAAMAILDVTGQRRVELPDLTASIYQGKASVIITDEDALPDVFCNFKRTPNKTAIRDWLDKGEAVPGAALSNGSASLTIRSK
jgi:hypothetical protein